MKIVQAVRIFRPRIETKDTLDGDVQIWARFDDEPSVDTLLATVHYSYGFMDNLRKREVARAIIELLEPSHDQ